MAAPLKIPQWLGAGKGVSEKEPMICISHLCLVSYSHHLFLIYFSLCESLLLRGLFSIYRERGLLSSCWAQAPLLRLLLLIALRHVRSSWIRDQTHVSYTGKKFLYHWATRETLSPCLIFTAHWWGSVISSILQKRTTKVWSRVLGLGPCTCTRFGAKYLVWILQVTADRRWQYSNQLHLISSLPSFHFSALE